MDEIEKVNILDVGINCISLEETVQIIDKFIGERKARMIFTPNIDHIITANENSEFLKCYKKADLSVVDGVPLLWIAKLLGHKLKGRVNGTDLMIACCQLAEERGHSIFLLGNEKHVAIKAVAELRNKHPELKIAGYYSPTFGFENDQKEINYILNLLKESKPDLLFVGLGSPKQEFFINNYIKKIEIPVSIGVGASIEYITGSTCRAPLWMQKNGFEWLYRVLQNPKRYFYRYLIRDTKIIAILFKYILLKRCNRK